MTTTQTWTDGAMLAKRAAPEYHGNNDVGGTVGQDKLFIVVLLPRGPVQRRQHRLQ